jgi:hypothetical protein
MKGVVGRLEIRPDLENQMITCFQTLATIIKWKGDSGSPWLRLNPRTGIAVQRIVDWLQKFRDEILGHKQLGKPFATKIGLRALHKIESKAWCKYSIKHWGDLHCDKIGLINEVMWYASPSREVCLIWMNQWIYDEIKAKKNTFWHGFDATIF